MIQKVLKNLNPLYLWMSLIQNVLLLLVLYSFYLKRIKHIAHPFDASSYLTAPISMYKMGFLFLFVLIGLTLLCAYFKYKKSFYGKNLFDLLFVIQLITVLPLMILFSKWNNSLIKMTFIVIIPFVVLSIVMIIYKLSRRRNIKNTSA